MALVLPASGLVTIVTATLLLLPLGEPSVFRFVVSAVSYQMPHFLASETCTGFYHCAVNLVFAAAAARGLLLRVRLLKVAGQNRVIPTFFSTWASTSQ